MTHITDLVLCTAALVLGPVIYQLARAKLSTYAFVDGFVLVGVGGMVLFEILPQSFSTIGLWMLPIAVFGFVFPHFLEHRLNSLPVSPRTILSTLIILGLVIHQLLDGAALSRGGDPEHAEQYALTTLGIAIILHQVPKGFLLWAISRKAGGLQAAIVVLSGLVGATLLGFVLGDKLLGLVEHSSVVYFQVFVAGGLLHVVVHHVSGGAEGVPRSSQAFWSGAGALVGLGLLAWLPHTHWVEDHDGHGLALRAALTELTLQSAPAILLGFLAAGVLQAFVSKKGLEWFQGSSRCNSALRGIVLGIPLPICSCGVTPIYQTLIQRGVPAAAAIAFLIATPEIGLDSFFLSYRMLGLKVTMARLAMAFLVALSAAMILAKLYSHVETDVGDVTAGGESLETGAASLRGKIKSALQYSTIHLVDHLGAWITAGLVLAAVCEPLIQPGWIAELPQGADVAILALLGLPIYVCASGATPLAAVLLSKGVSAGAVLAFLITGPTTNMTTFGLLSRLHGRRRALALPFTVLALAMAFGWIMNGLSSALPQATPAMEGPCTPGMVDFASALVLLMLLAASILRTGPRRFLGSLLGEASLGDSGTQETRASSHGHSHDHERHG